MRIMWALLCGLGLAHGAVPADEVPVYPGGFNKTEFKVYSGYITVPGPFDMNDYDQLQIHYELHCSQDAVTDPLVTWHQGGPGGSSLLGAFTEMGYFQLSHDGNFVNPYAWNNVANMLYLESPAGSGQGHGFSKCMKGGSAVRCHWDDKSQAEAYAKTLLAFLNAYPEFRTNELYLTGESYSGQYLPNIATYILDKNVSLNLKGIMVGNGCWGGTETSVLCNGPNENKIDTDLFYGHALVSTKLRDEIYKTCGWDNSGGRNPIKCSENLRLMDNAVGPHNVYDIYDNCYALSGWLEKANKTNSWLRHYMRENMNNANLEEDLVTLSGGYQWPCGGANAMGTFLTTRANYEALHLNTPGASGFSYTTSGPASMLLYPDLVKKIRVLIYNGDADACVPHYGNEYWTTQMAANGHVKETSAWHPWFERPGHGIPAGYATVYNVTGVPGNTFMYLTIRLAGHMVPQFRPGPALTLITRYLNNQPF